MFDATEFSEAAVWSPKDQWIPHDVVLHMDRPDYPSALGQVDLVGTVYRAKVRVSDLPQDAGRGDRVNITGTGERFKVIKPFEYDETRRIATVHLQPIED